MVRDSSCIRQEAQKPLRKIESFDLSKYELQKNWQQSRETNGRTGKNIRRSMTNRSLIPWNAEFPQIGKIKMEVVICSKMASASSIIQVIKPHPPLIRFPDRRDDPTPNASELLRWAGLLSHPSSVSQHAKGSKSLDWLMDQSPSDTAEVIKTLP